MNVALVTVGYNLPGLTKRLVDSALSGCSHDLSFMLFSHSQMIEKIEELAELAKRPNVRLKDYRANRGLAKSWNEGIFDAHAENFDVILVANEDVRFSKGDVNRLVQAAVEHPENYLITGRAYHASESTWSSSEYGCFAINRIAIERLGAFDENLFPVYFEDADYRRRASLALLRSGHCPDTEIYHDGSRSLSQPEVAQQNSLTWTKNREYFNRKWGGDPGQEKFLHPFDDRRFSYFIDPKLSDAPYAGLNRSDHDIVKV